MNIYLRHLETAVPEYSYSQDFARERMKEWVTDPKLKRLTHALYARSGIEKRHAVTGDFVEGVEPQLYRLDGEGRIIQPSTQQRNEIYAKESKRLAVEVARRLLEQPGAPDASEVTHLIFASCTGFCNPGPDYAVIREVGLPENVERYTLGFMGCYAAFPALRMARQFCEADPHAVVMIICLELCSLHLQIEDRADSMLANSLFADGAGAALVTAREPEPGAPAVVLDGFCSALVPSGEADMAWDIGDHGFNIVLSSYVPEVIGANMTEILSGVLEREEVLLEEIDEWAIHPGGRAILDRVESSLSLPPDALESSRRVLRDFGNMSSATILFVLKDLMVTKPLPEGRTVAVAFGPGLTVETALLRRVGEPVVAGRELTLEEDVATV